MRESKMKLRCSRVLYGKGITFNFPSWSLLGSGRKKLLSWARVHISYSRSHNGFRKRTWVKKRLGGIRTSVFLF